MLKIKTKMDTIETDKVNKQNLLNEFMIFFPHSENIILRIPAFPHIYHIHKDLLSDYFKLGIRILTLVELNK